MIPESSPGNHFSIDADDIIDVALHHEIKFRAYELYERHHGEWKKSNYVMSSAFNDIEEVDDCSRTAIVPPGVRVPSRLAQDRDCTHR